MIARAKILDAKIKKVFLERPESERVRQLENKIQELKAKVSEYEKEIDQLVYKLYDLTEEEIKIVEG